MTEPARAPLECDLVIGGIPRFRAEAPWAWSLLSRYARQIPCRRRVETPGRAPLLSDAAGDSPLLLVVADPESFLPPPAARRLTETLSRHPEIDVLLPVSNEASSEEARAAPAFAYLTPSLLEETARAFADRAGQPRQARDPRSPVFLARRVALAALPAAFPLGGAAEALSRRGARVAVDPGAYVHRYGQMNAQARTDLADLLPEETRAVLDVGCARGATAAELRRRGAAYLAGIEPDQEDARAASEVYDRVVAAPLESVADTWDRKFDAILFGDVLEHLAEPARALERVRPWLSERGTVVASLPNVGHWAIVSDLLEGRFDYVPYSILSGTHLRFFTRSTLVELFEQCGYRIERIEAVRLPASPEGEARLRRLAALPGASPDLDVAEFLVVARRA